MRESALELLIPSVCPACDAARPETARLLCAACTLDLRPLEAQGRVRTVYAYAGTALTLIRRFKFDGRHDALQVLLPALAERVRALGADALVPVPRHRSRVRRLGGDPVHQLARALARVLRVELLDEVLMRSRATPPQAGLGLVERRTNPLGSFRARPGALAGRSVLLLDDVTTTGATLVAAARALREARPARALRVAVAGTPLV